jgi:antitoxin ParD1/3/4
MAISADLGETLETYVTKLVANGRYNSKSEVLREGIRLLQERETKLAALEAMIDAGASDIMQGRTVSAEQVFARLEAKYAALSKKAAS